MSKFDDFTTVRSVADGDVVFVGEEHGNTWSKKLGEQVIAEVKPNVVAIEKGETYTAPRPSAGAMGACKEYAEQNGVPLLCIDENRSEYRGRYPDDVSSGRVLEVGNEFSHKIERDGDMNYYSIINARESIKDEFGMEVYDAFYTFRERGMVARLKRALERYEPPIVAAVGTFHIIGLEDMWNFVEQKKPLEDNRRFYEGNVEEAPAARA